MTAAMIKYSLNIDMQKTRTLEQIIEDLEGVVCALRLGGAPDLPHRLVFGERAIDFVLTGYKPPMFTPLKQHGM